MRGFTDSPEPHDRRAASPSRRDSRNEEYEDNKRSEVNSGDNARRDSRSSGRSIGTRNGESSRTGAAADRWERGQVVSGVDGDSPTAIATALRRLEEDVADWRPSGIVDERPPIDAPTQHQRESVRLSSADLADDTPHRFMTSLPFPAVGGPIIGQGGRTQKRIKHEAPLGVLRVYQPKLGESTLELIGAKRGIFKALEMVEDAVYRDRWDATSLQRLQDRSWLEFDMSKCRPHDGPPVWEKRGESHVSEPEPILGTSRRSTSPPPDRAVYHHSFTFPFRKAGAIFVGPSGEVLARLKQAAGLVRLDLHQTSRSEAACRLSGSLRSIRRALSIMEQSIYKELDHVWNPWEKRKLSDRRWAEFRESRAEPERGLWLDEEAVAAAEKREQEPLPGPFLQSTSRNALDWADQDLPPPPGMRGAQSAQRPPRVGYSVRREGARGGAGGPGAGGAGAGWGRSRYRDPDEDGRGGLRSSRRGDGDDEPRRYRSPSRSRSRSPVRLRSLSSDSAYSRRDRERRGSRDEDYSPRRRRRDSASPMQEAERDDAGASSRSKVERVIPIPSSAAARFLAPSTTSAFIEENTGATVALESSRSGSSLRIEAPSQDALEQALEDVERVVGKVEKGWRVPA
ncbi:hypothetical protein JCM8097_006141 [Rhodosporidiobolus ruineniae]